MEAILTAIIVRRLNRFSSSIPLGENTCRLHGSTQIKFNGDGNAVCLVDGCGMDNIIHADIDAEAQAMVAEIMKSYKVE